MRYNFSVEWIQENIFRSSFYFLLSSSTEKGAMEFLITAQHTEDKMLTAADKTNYRHLVFSSTINLLTYSCGG